MIRIPVSRYVSASVLALALAMPVALSPMLTSPAHAFGFGRIVYDPTNYAQNLLTAARTLEQINHQITSLQNEAQMLINQAKNLASLPYSSLQTLQQNVQRTQQLLAQAQNIAFDVQNVDQMFQQKYGRFCCPRPTPSSSPMRGPAGRIRSAACRTPCACRPVSSEILTPTALKCPPL